MTTAYFSPSLKSFIPAAWKEDGTYTEDSWPVDAVLATDEEVAMFWKQTPPPRKMLGVIDERPAWVDLPPLTDEQLAEIKAINVTQTQETKIKLISGASDKIETLKDRIDAGQDKAAELKLWKLYRIALDDIDVNSAPDIEWPLAPE
ncbi:tail fiber assembly protein [Yersinia sp. 2466 StPb PI]|uniref:tail fiber assembly protein n=1 Tax=Yersinia sp. 2466 StPb PI TaxID=3061648 RepID=UPI00355BC22A